MSQTKHKPKYKFGPSLPKGSALEWDMTALTDEQLEYEHKLSYESLYGHTIDGEVVLPGLLSPDANHKGFYKEIIDNALFVWKSRHQRALDELERRFLLS